ncbi:MAG: hypothetical protein Q4A19_01395 [Johnsonella sp.]|nr:hypothetical protein [Johnsonella sp.]
MVFDLSKSEKSIVLLKGLALFSALCYTGLAFRNRADKRDKNRKAALYILE